MQFSVEDCYNILSDLSVNDVIVSPHFNQRLKGRGVDISNHILKYLDQEDTEITPAKGYNRFMLKYYCKPLGKELTLILHIQDNAQIVLVTIY